MFDLVILALAVARLSRFLVSDSLFDKPREWLLTRWPTETTDFGDSEVSDGVLTSGVEVFRADDAWYVLKSHKWSELFTCCWCNSFWIAVLAWVAYQFYPDVTVILAAPFALSFVAGWLNDR